MKLFCLAVLVCYLNINSAQNIAEFPSSFLWGLATAPAHTEDHLDDSWLEWALAGKIPWTGEGFQTERRLDFWSNPGM